MTQSEKKNLFYSNVIFIFYFLIFVIFYFFNSDTYNMFAVDYHARYKSEGILIINQLLSQNFEELVIFDFYFIPKFLTGLFIKLFPDQLHFSIISNILNIIIMFLSLYFFIKSLKQNNYTTFFFLIIFFSYKSNWIYCFLKLPDIFFLFNFSIIFFLLNKSFQTNKNFFLFSSWFFAIISIFIRPQGVVVLFFVFISSCYFFRRKINLIPFTIFASILYIFLYPFLVILMTKFDDVNFIYSNLSIINSGQIYYDVYFTRDFFYEQFSINESIVSEIFYYYVLFFKKFIYQITFIRESYSLLHNIFLIIYCLGIYSVIIFSLSVYRTKFKYISELIFVITSLSLLFHSSIYIGGEPNRYQLFYLTPWYLLVAMGLSEFLKNFRANKLKYISFLI